jgi:hypothetical protein
LEANMPTPVKPLAKSLHTHTVLMHLARHFLKSRMMIPACPTPGWDARFAVSCALDVLQLEHAPDPYGLAQRAREQLAEEIKDEPRYQ